MNLAMSPGAVPLYEAVVAFIKNEIDPVTEEYFKLGEGRPDRWQYGKGQLELLESIKAKAKAKADGSSHGAARPKQAEGTPPSQPPSPNVQPKP